MSRSSGYLVGAPVGDTPGNVQENCVDSYSGEALTPCWNSRCQHGTVPRLQLFTSTLSGQNPWR
ncbi:hypothetical protein [Yersinia aldovae]|uniref:hypothetical protein n=1 Tax=Yersinia aldovae TaxID=29483 RepID=UPI0011A98794|nr:hypothetical protein [Yersinia aldovae]